MATNMENPGLNATSWWTVDTSEELQLTVGATPLVKKCMQKHGWSLDFCQQVLEGYKKLLMFMNMFQDYDAKKYYPPIPVDKMWEEHALDVTVYMADCQLLFGRVIHRPNDLATLDEDTKDQRINRTLYVLRLQCKDNYDRSVWDFGRPVDAVEGKNKRGLRPRTNRVDWSKKLEDDEGESTSLRVYSSKRKVDTRLEERKRRRTKDGCMLPNRDPKKKEDGTYSKPAGRCPAGMVWDMHRGVFAPTTNQPPLAEPVAKVKTPRATVLKEKNTTPRETGSVSKTEGRRTPDGCVLPLRPPRKNAQGTFNRPAGRIPAGMVWDHVRGVYAPKPTPRRHAKAAPTNTRRRREPDPELETPSTAALKKLDSSSRTRVDRRIETDGRKMQDGCVLPLRAPKKNADGTFVRPSGRTPHGLVWDENRGVYAPPTEPLPSVATSAPSIQRPREERKSTSVPTKKYSQAENKKATKGHRTPDGCFRPGTEPRKQEDGTFARPKGRAPAGMTWSFSLGLFVPKVRAIPCVTPTASIGSTDEGDIFNGVDTSSHVAERARRVSTDI